MESFERSEHTLFSTPFLCTAEEFRRIYGALAVASCYRRWQKADTVVKVLRTPLLDVARAAAEDEASAYIECVLLTQRLVEQFIKETS